MKDIHYTFQTSVDFKMFLKVEEILNMYIITYKYL